RRLDVLEQPLQVLLKEKEGANVMFRRFCEASIPDVFGLVAPPVGAIHKLSASAPIRSGYGHAVNVCRNRQCDAGRIIAIRQSKTILATILSSGPGATFKNQ